MHIIIIGLGGIGQNLARIAVAEKHNVVVIDNNAKKCNDIVTKYDLISVNGDATSATILDEAGVSETDAVIATTSSDAVNLLALLQAKDKGVKNLRSIVNEFEHEDIFQREGITIHKNPSAIVAEDIYNNMLRPGINDFVTIGAGKAEIVDILIKEGTKAAGRSIKDIGLPSNVLVIAVERGDDVIIPDGNTVVLPGDSVFVFIRKNLADKVFNTFSVGNLVR
ncbi:Trk system potassium uptake protein TrkA homolog [Methanocella paludicola SANAE]|uniref:Trk system potassium uptake protein TrkA homolog n=1 Tax=Methanocella paludicola (strain DSM 17711 / JCM 13418 / NBRC 101707 / SANAE) TaxID=304371 RepID=D1YVZ9_METPS|nr:NAD-binding protein [Methanocella paludicola]BAI60621.1 Trk system potassium uptake protein TrkA homolog [Methanocella paludicola SANAE]